MTDHIFNETHWLACGKVRKRNSKDPFHIRLRYVRALKPNAIARAQELFSLDNYEIRSTYLLLELSKDQADRIQFMLKELEND